MKRLGMLAACLLVSAGPRLMAQQFSVTGMVLEVDRSRKSFVASCEDIPGYMKAMAMPFQVRDAKALDGLAPGATVEFTLVVDKESSYAEHIEIRRYQSVEQDPLTAERLKQLNQLSQGASSLRKALSPGQAVPDFTLTDQAGREISLAQFSGKVVAINFIYTSCSLPNYCLRIANNFGALQKRFQEKLGRDLVLLSVTFDPVHDQPDVLARYAKTWKADPETWHFLTGPVPEVERITGLFGVDYFLNEGFMDHSLHTAIIDRQGKLVANVEGNQFTADQLGDLVQTILTRRAADTERKNQAHVARDAGPK
jgi:protein SCO1